MLLKRMLDGLGFREALGTFGLPLPWSNRGYLPWQLIEQFIVSIWCGASRFAHAETVRFDRTLTRVFGWHRVAGHKAIVRQRAPDSERRRAGPFMARSLSSPAR